MHRPDEEIIAATMKELEHLFPQEIRADGSLAKVGGAGVAGVGAAVHVRQVVWSSHMVVQLWGSLGAQHNT